jgi:hypothetical protein
MRKLCILIVIVILGACHRPPAYGGTGNDWNPCPYADRASLSAPVWALSADSVIGRVEGPDGDRLVGAVVMVAPHGTTGQERSLGALTGRRGEFTLRGLRPGGFDLRVDYFAFPPIHRPIEVKERAPVDTLVIVMSCHRD